MADTFKLIVVTPEKDIAEEPALIKALFEAGLTILHVRKPDFSSQELISLFKAIPQEFHPKIVIHNNYELLNNFNLKGAHLPEKNRKGGDISWIKNIVSTSFHRLEDIRAEKINFEYVFFSPVFQSISKKGYGPSVEIKVLNEFLHTKGTQIPFPIVALGGITDKTILQAKDMGFNGAACIGYIWEGSNPVERFIKLQKIIQD